MKPSVAVLGGAGYIGSQVIRLLRHQGLDPVAYDDLSQGQVAALAGAPLVVGDIGDTEKLGMMFKQYQINTVMHFAAVSDVAQSVVDPQTCYTQNVIKTAAVLDTVLKLAIPHFIFSSSASIYGHPQSVPISEEHPCQPLNPYGRSKMAIEYMLADYAQAYPGFNYVSLRYFNAAGADPGGGFGEQHQPETHLIPLVMEVANGRRPYLRVYGTDYDTPDGTCIRDYIHVADLAQAHGLALRWVIEQRHSDCFNLGNGQGFSVQQIVTAARDLTGHPIPVVEVPRRLGDPAILVGSSAKAHRILKWEPRFPDLSNILASAWQWEQQRTEILVGSLGA